MWVDQNSLGQCGGGHGFGGRGTQRSTMSNDCGGLTKDGQQQRRQRCGLLVDEMDVGSWDGWH